MITSRKTIVLVATSLAACVTAATMGLAIMSGPAVSHDMRAGAGSPASCETATWPYIPARCLKGIHDTQRKFTYARPKMAEPR